MHPHADPEVMALLAKLKVGHTWEALAQVLGVNRGLLWRVARGEGGSPQVRAALGLPPLAVEVVPCPCGEPHTHLCEEGRRLVRRGRSREPHMLRQIQIVGVPFLRAARARKEGDNA